MGRRRSSALASTGGAGDSGGGGDPQFVQPTIAGAYVVPKQTSAGEVWIPVDSSAGPFPVTFPAAPPVGLIVWVTDVGATGVAANGFASNPVTVSGGTLNVQDPHTMTRTTTSYACGIANADAGGATLGWIFTGSFWKAIL